MRISIVGAGSIGLHLAARLASAGADAGIVSRQPESADLLRREGVHVLDPSADPGWRAAIPRASSIAEGDAFRRDDALLLCCREPDLPPLLRRLAVAVPQTTIVCCQNGSQPEAHALHHFRNVIGLLVRHTCMREATNRVRVRGAPRIVLGAAAARPLDARGEEVLRWLQGALDASGCDVGVSSSLDEDRWLKLCANTLSPVNALVRRRDHASPEFAALKVALLEEARDCLRAARLVARSCDGRDPSLDEMIEGLRRGANRGESGRGTPVCNSVWTALRTGAPLEAGEHLAEFLELGQRFGVATPTQRRVRDLLLQSYRDGVGPESMAVSAFEAAPTSRSPGDRAR